MATLEIKIPDSQFTSGGRFYGQDKNKVQVLLGFQTKGNRALPIMNTPITIEDWEFRPLDVNDKEDVYYLIDNNLIEISIGGAVQTPALLSAMMMNLYQDI